MDNGYCSFEEMLIKGIQNPSFLATFIDNFMGFLLRWSCLPIEEFSVIKFYHTYLITIDYVWICFTKVGKKTKCSWQQTVWTFRHTTYYKHTCTLDPNKWDVHKIAVISLTVSSCYYNVSVTCSTVSWYINFDRRFAMNFTYFFF